MMLYTLLLCACVVTHSVKGQHNYADILAKSLLFYEAQRSGYLPQNNRIPYRGDSATRDGSDKGLQLDGGWYDAGDHVKFGFPMAWSTTTLAWGIIEFRDAYINSGQLEWALDSIKWPLDYFIKCHISDNEFYGQVGDGYADHSYWGRPEQMTMYRPSSKIDTGKPGSDLAGETSAAMTAGSLAFRQTDSSYADTLLNHAKKLHEFAYNYQGYYTNAIPAYNFYRSSGYRDEIAWSAIWLYIATGEQKYKNRAKAYYSNGVPWAFSWDDKNAGIQLLMYKATRKAQYANHVKAFLRSWFPGGGLTYTPQGLAWRDRWGPLRYTASTAAIALLAAKEGIIAQEATNWARGQIGYMLGDNNKGFSYVIGYGTKFPRKPHHRSSSCNPNHSVPCNWNDYNSADPNDSELTGALVGGPDQNDNYEDKRQDYVANEVATDYNAGFQTAIAGLLSSSSTK